MNSTGEVLSSGLADKVNAEYAAADVGSAICIQARKGQGLCVVAARSIEANEVFLTETPLLVAGHVFTLYYLPFTLQTLPFTFLLRHHRVA